MTASQKQVDFAHHRMLTLTLPTSSSLEDEETEVASPISRDDRNTRELPSSALAEPQPTPPLSFSGRCSIRGCVFQAIENARGICWIHALMQKEPEKFHTLQPTGWLLELAKYGITTEDEDTHVRQIIRAKEVRRAFLEEVA